MVTIKRHLRILLALAILLIIAGCQSKEAEPVSPKEQPVETPKESPSMNPEDDNEEKEEPSLDAPPLPQTLEEVVQYPLGEYESDDSELSESVKTHIEELSPVDATAEEEAIKELFAYTYSLFKTEYDDPVKVLDMVTNEKQGSEQPEQEKGSYNVVIAVDASGSMANKIGSKTRMELAKEAIHSFASKLPKEANVGLRVYGHKGSGSSSDKEMSCSSNELVHPVQPFTESGLKTALSAFDPAGWTPLAGAIEQAQKDLEPYQGEHDENVIFVVSDGVETCGGDPVKAAAGLKDSGISPVVHIIGFDVASSEQQQLKDVAAAAGGNYINAKDHQQLKAEFDKTLQNAIEWQKWYLEEQGNIRDQYYDQWQLIHDFYYGWKPQLLNEKTKIQYAIAEMNYKKIITNEQKDALMKKRDQFYADIESQLLKMKDVLDSTNKDNYQNMKSELEEIYSGQVSN